MYTPLDADTNRMFGLLLMCLGILFATPPGFPPDDIVNIVTAGALVNMFNWSMAFALLFTYTAIPALLIVIGASIYPYNTVRLLHGKWNLIKSVAYKAYRRPFLTLVSVYICYKILIWYQGNIVHSLTVGGLI